MRPQLADNVRRSPCSPGASVHFRRPFRRLPNRTNMDRPGVLRTSPTTSSGLAPPLRDNDGTRLRPGARDDAPVRRLFLSSSPPTMKRRARRRRRAGWREGCYYWKPRLWGLDRDRLIFGRTLASTTTVLSFAAVSTPADSGLLLTPHRQLAGRWDGRACVEVQAVAAALEGLGFRRISPFLRCSMRSAAGLGPATAERALGDSAEIIVDGRHPANSSHVETHRLSEQIGMARPWRRFQLSWTALR